nr:hypothetical protein [Tanacetum cinerariifolium]
MMRQNKNLIDINIDALYNILKQNLGDVNDVMGLKKKTDVVTSDPLTLIAKKMKVSKRKEKVVVSLDSKGRRTFAKDYKKAKVKDYNYYKTKMLLAKKDSDEQVLLAKDQAWMESSSDSDQEINENMVFIAQIKKVLSDSETGSSSADDKISEIMKSSTTNVETLINKEVFHEISKSFQGESSSSSLNDNVQQSPKEDAYFDASTSFHDPSNVYTFYQPYPNEKKWTKDHPLYKIIGDPKSSVRTRGQLANSCLFSCLLSSIKPANVAEALRNADWVSAMQDELDQFARLKVWRLVPRPKGKTIIKTKWIFKNKKDEICLVIQNKARLVAVGYSQQEGIDSFLNGIFKEEVYVGQPLGFVGKQYPDHVYALDKALYGLKQAPQAWYDVLLQFLIDSSFQKAESEYVAVSSCCAQVLWMRTQLTDYGFFYDKVPIYCDSRSAIAISCNLVHHTCTKHIDVSFPTSSDVFPLSEEVSTARRKFPLPEEVPTGSAK